MSTEMVATFLHDMASKTMAKAGEFRREGSPESITKAIHYRGVAQGILLAWTALTTGETDTGRDELSRLEKEAGLQ